MFSRSRNQPLIFARRSHGQATTFHKFNEELKNPANVPMANNVLHNMEVLNRDGSISDQEGVQSFLDIRCIELLQGPRIDD